MNRQAGAFIGLTAVVSFLLGLVVAGTRSTHRVADLLPVHRAIGEPLRLSTGVHSLPGPIGVPGGGVDFAAVAATVNAAVVNVDTAFRGSDEPRRYAPRYSTDDPSAPHEGTCSGFIIRTS